MSADARYLAVFTMDKAGPKFRAWKAMTEAEQARRAEIGVAAVKAWETAHRDSIVHVGGPLGPTLRIDDAGRITEVANLLTVFVVVRADSHEAAARLFEGHPHMAIFPCDGVEVMPVWAETDAFRFRQRRNRRAPPHLTSPHGMETVMKALCWQGKEKIRCEEVPDPEIQDGRDAIIRVTSCAICGSDLHLYGGFVPGMKHGDVMGHETMGEVVAVGKDNRKLKVGDRVVVPFTISCGDCEFCKRSLFSLCEVSNPAGAEQAKMIGYPTAGLFGYTHTYGGFPGGQAEYLRVPFADVGPIKAPDGLSDDQVLFLSDIFPTGWMAAENADIRPGHTVLVFGCGPVGQFAIRSAFMMGAERVIAIDEVEERLRMAEAGGAETIDFSEAEGELQDRILAMTNGRGPDSVIEAVGLESHGSGSMIEKVQETVAGKMERAYAFNQAIVACRPGGTISLPGVFVGGVPVMMGAFVGKGLTLRTGQTHVQRYLEPLMRKIEEGEIDPSFLITHKIRLEDGPDMYKTFQEKKDGCVKIVINP